MPLSQVLIHPLNLVPKTFFPGLDKKAHRYPDLGYYYDVLTVCHLYDVTD